jgi:hypothetical protein
VSYVQSHLRPKLRVSTTSMAWLSTYSTCSSSLGRRFQTFRNLLTIVVDTRKSTRTIVHEGDLLVQEVRELRSEPFEAQVARINNYLGMSLFYGLAFYIFHMLVQPGEAVSNLPKPAHDSCQIDDDFSLFNLMAFWLR